MPWIKEGIATPTLQKSKNSADCWVEMPWIKEGIATVLTALLSHTSLITLLKCPEKRKGLRTHTLSSWHLHIWLLKCPEKRKGLRNDLLASFVLLHDTVLKCPEKRKGLRKSKNLPSDPKRPLYRCWNALKKGRDCDHVDTIHAIVPLVVEMPWIKEGIATIGILRLFRAQEWELKCPE